MQTNNEDPQKTARTCMRQPTLASCSPWPCLPPSVNTRPKVRLCPRFCVSVRFVFVFVVAGFFGWVREGGRFCVGVCVCVVLQFFWWG